MAFSIGFLFPSQASEAFVNDAVMSSQLDKVVSQVEARRAELAASLEVLQGKIPDCVTFDSQGRIFLKPLGAASGGSALSPAVSGLPVDAPSSRTPSRVGNDESVGMEGATAEGWQAASPVKQPAVQNGYGGSSRIMVGLSSGPINGEAMTHRAMTQSGKSLRRNH